MGLKRLILIREESGPDRTFGSIFWRDRFVCHTLEPGDNDTLAPRVPPGFYHLTPHGWAPDSPVKFKDTWALNGEIVSAQPEAGVPRAAVLIHAGNIDDQTRGCILPGLGRGVVNGEPAVTQSKAAMEELRDIIGNGQAYLTIMGV